MHDFCVKATHIRSGDDSSNYCTDLPNSMGLDALGYAGVATNHGRVPAEAS